MPELRSLYTCEIHVESRRVSMFSCHEVICGVVCSALDVLHRGRPAETAHEPTTEGPGGQDEEVREDHLGCLFHTAARRCVVKHSCVSNNFIL